MLRNETQDNAATRAVLHDVRKWIATFERRIYSRISGAEH
jgi:hypothetical protein